LDVWRFSSCEYHGSEKKWFLDNFQNIFEAKFESKPGPSGTKSRTARMPKEYKNLNRRITKLELIEKLP
jgi:hypothetical protein